MTLDVGDELRRELTADEGRVAVCAVSAHAVRGFAQENRSFLRRIAALTAFGAQLGPDSNEKFGDVFADRRVVPVG